MTDEECLMHAAEIMAEGVFKRRAMVTKEDLSNLFFATLKETHELGKSSIEREGSRVEII